MLPLDPLSLLASMAAVLALALTPVPADRVAPGPPDTAALAPAESAAPAPADAVAPADGVAPAPADTVVERCRVLPTAPDAVEQIRHRTLQARGETSAVGFPTRIRVGIGCGFDSDGPVGGPEGLVPRFELQGFGGGRDGHLRSTPGRPPAAAPDEARGGLHQGTRVRVLEALHSRVLVHVDGTLEVNDEGWEGRVRALAVHADLGPLHGWMGRTAPAYGPGRSGGLILTGAVPLDGVGLGLTRPGRLPGILAPLGKADFEIVLAQGGRNHEIGAPWLLAGRGTLVPGAGVVLAVNRGIMFGGEGAAGISPRRMFLVLAGAHARDDGEVVPFSNQIASFEVAWRGAVARVPLFAYLEWGMEDNSGAWARSPGVVSGMEAAHPERPVRIGLERTYMSGVNGHGAWYRHSVYREGWSDRGRLLGHPLAGPGTEWLVHGAVHHRSARESDGAWEVELGLRTRDRLPENSYSPVLQGRSFGGFVQARSVAGPVELFLQVDGERLRDGGAAWVEGRAGVRWTAGDR